MEEHGTGVRRLLPDLVWQTIISQLLLVAKMEGDVFIGSITR